MFYKFLKNFKIKSILTKEIECIFILHILNVVLLLNFLFSTNLTFDLFTDFTTIFLFYLITVKKKNSLSVINKSSYKLLKLANLSQVITYICGVSLLKIGPLVEEHNEVILYVILFIGMLSLLFNIPIRLISLYQFCKFIKLNFFSNQISKKHNQ